MTEPLTKGELHKIQKLITDEVVRLTPQLTNLIQEDPAHQQVVEMARRINKWNQLNDRVGSQIPNAPTGER